MAKQESLKFNNNRSVRFGLDSFAIPVNKSTPKKNTMYAALLSGMAGTKNKLSVPAAVNNYGYTMTTKWRDWTFAANSNGIYAANETMIFQLVSNTIYPTKLLVAADRLFAIIPSGQKLFHTVDLKGAWTPANAVSGVIYSPDGYGKMVDIGLYRGNLLVVCENGLWVVDRKLNVKHLTDDSGTVIANMTQGPERIWESDWFSLGYATDTQTLREVFLKTNVPIKMSVLSNRTSKTITVKPSGTIRKNKINLRGDQFKIRIQVPAGSFEISNLSAVIGFGTKAD